MISRLFVSFIFAVCMASGAQQSWAKDGSPTSQVKAVLDRAMDIQTRPELAGEANRGKRGKLIRELIGEHFLSADMARESLKDTWNSISSQQRSEFQSLFARLFQDSYTRLVLNFLQKEAIEYSGESKESRGVAVKTTIMRANEHIPVDYHLAQKDGRWMIRDVDIDGVSIVENYKNKFGSVIRSGSFSSLMEKLRLQSKVIQDDLT